MVNNNLFEIITKNTKMIIKIDIGDRIFHLPVQCNAICIIFFL